MGFSSVVVDVVVDVVVGVDADIDAAVDARSLGAICPLGCLGGWRRRDIMEAL